MQDRDYFSFKEGTMTSEMRERVEKYGHPYRVSQAGFTKESYFKRCPKCGYHKG